MDYLLYYEVLLRRIVHINNIMTDNTIFDDSEVKSYFKDTVLDLHSMAKVKKNDRTHKYDYIDKENSNRRIKEINKIILLDKAYESVMLEDTYIIINKIKELDKVIFVTDFTCVQDVYFKIRIFVGNESNLIDNTIRSTTIDVRVPAKELGFLLIKDNSLSKYSDSRLSSILLKYTRQFINDNYTPVVCGIPIPVKNDKVEAEIRIESNDVDVRYLVSESSRKVSFIFTDNTVVTLPHESVISKYINKDDKLNIHKYISQELYEFCKRML